MRIGEYVKKIREDKEITQRGLAIKAGVSNSTISNLESMTRVPNVAILKKIASALNIEYIEMLKHLDDSVQEDMYTEDDVIKVQMVNLPVVGTVRAGTPILAVENIERYVPVASMYLSKAKEYFILRITGDSMDQLFPGGALALIEKTDMVEDGNIAVVAINGDEATIKKVQFAGDGIMLIPMSHNPIHQPKFYHMEKDDIHIIGRLKLSMTEY